jgi:hypothetical protein
MRWCALTICTVVMLLASGSPALAAPFSGLEHACKYTYGRGDYQGVSYDGKTTCWEAGRLIAQSTNVGKRKPVVGTKTVRTDFGPWRCTTIRRREAHGVIESTYRITCSLRAADRKPARVRFFYY